jgi:hypothetical protein
MRKLIHQEKAWWVLIAEGARSCCSGFKLRTIYGTLEEVSTKIKADPVEFLVAQGEGGYCFYDLAHVKVLGVDGQECEPPEQILSWLYDLSAKEQQRLIQEYEEYYG